MAAPEPPVVSNTTPLITLAGVGQLDLLRSLFGNITIAAAVRDEYAAGKTAADPDLASLS